MDHTGTVWKCVVWNHVARTEGWRPTNRGFYPLYRQEIISFLNCSIKALEPDHPLIQRTSEAISPGLRRREHKADHSLLVPRLRMTGVTRTLPNTPSRRVEIHRLVVTIIPLMAGQACQCYQPMASLRKLQRAT